MSNLIEGSDSLVLQNNVFNNKRRSNKVGLSSVNSVNASMVFDSSTQVVRKPATSNMPSTQAIRSTVNMRLQESTTVPTSL